MVSLNYADGGTSRGPRSFLVIDTDVVTNKITLLNVSSIRGKSHKLLYPSNEPIKRYNPPFYLRSFVKLDAIYQIEYFPELEDKLMANGRQLNTEEQIEIEDKFTAYSLTNECLNVYYETIEIKQLNGM